MSRTRSKLNFLQFFKKFAIFTVPVKKRNSSTHVHKISLPYNTLACLSRPLRAILIFFQHLSIRVITFSSISSLFQVRSSRILSKKIRHWSFNLHIN